MAGGFFKCCIVQLEWGRGVGRRGEGVVSVVSGWGLHLLYATTTSYDEQLTQLIRDVWQTNPNWSGFQQELIPSSRPAVASLSVPETLTCDVVLSCPRVWLSGAERDAQPTLSHLHALLPLTMSIRGGRETVAHRVEAFAVRSPCHMSPLGSHLAVVLRMLDAVVHHLEQVNLWDHGDTNAFLRVMWHS